MTNSTSPVLLTWSQFSEALEDKDPNIFMLLQWNFPLVMTPYGRADDLQKILAWARGASRTPAARLITGQGGVGKTRLAALAAQTLRDEGWTAGFLRTGENLPGPEVGSKGLFAILDYPEEQPERTSAVLAQLAEMPTAAYALRVVFLSRRSFKEWERETLILKGRFGTHELAMPGVLSVEDGLALIAEAAENLAERANLLVPDLATAKAWLETSALHQLPLYATAAAIHAVLSPSEAFGFGGAELLKQLAFREIKRVISVSRALGLGDEGLERLLALGALADGLSEEAILELTRGGIFGREEPEDVVAAIAKSPWWKRGRLIRLEPDLLAAAFIDSALFGPSFPQGRAKLPDWLCVALRENAAALGVRLGRILHDLNFLTRGESRPHSLDLCLHRMLANDASRAVSFESVTRAPVPFSAANFAASVALILAAHATDPETAAWFRYSASVHLSVSGRREEALVAAREALKLYRGVAIVTRTMASIPNVVMSLNNLAFVLLTCDRWAEGVSTAYMAEAFCRELAARFPENGVPYLAKALGTLARGLSRLGRREEALSAAQEAAGLIRDAARANPEALAIPLGDSLDTLATVLLSLGRQDEALAVAREAVNHDRKLAVTHPQVFAPKLASSLVSLAAALAEIGRRKQALAAAREAVVLYRRLALIHPEMFEPQLASSLTILSFRLEEIGQEESLARAQEAVNLYRKLAATHPDIFTPELAGSLNALTLSERPAEALAQAKETVDLFRSLARAQPNSFTVGLKLSLNNLSARLAQCGQQQEALAVAQEVSALNVSE